MHQKLTGSDKGAIVLTGNACMHDNGEQSCMKLGDRVRGDCRCCAARAASAFFSSAVEASRPSCISKATDIEDSDGAACRKSGYLDNFLGEGDTRARKRLVSDDQPVEAAAELRTPVHRDRLEPKLWIQFFAQARSGGINLNLNLLLP